MAGSKKEVSALTPFLLITSLSRSQIPFLCKNEVKLATYYLFTSKFSDATGRRYQPEINNQNRTNRVKKKLNMEEYEYS